MRKKEIYVVGNEKMITGENIDGDWIKPYSTLQGAEEFKKCLLIGSDDCKIYKLVEVKK